MQRLRTRVRRVLNRLRGVDSAVLNEMRTSLARIEAQLAVRQPSVAYLGDSEAVVSTTWGRRLLVRTDDYIIAPSLLSTGCYEPGLTALFPSLIRAGGTVIDVGANIGYYSVLAGSIVGADGFVVAYEPHPAVARLLRLNLILNAMADASTVAMVAAHSGPAEISFYTRLRFAANSSIAPVTQAELDHLEDTQVEVRVTAVDLDSHLRSIGRSSNIQLMKIDVEGGELFALQGAEGVIRSARPRLLLEWSPGQQIRAGCAPSDLVEFLEGLDLDAATIDAETGALTRTSLRDVLQLDYTNILLVPAGAPLTLG